MYYYYGPYYGPELYHYGVKGMKWGVRKERSENGQRRLTLDRYGNAYLRLTNRRVGGTYKQSTKLRMQKKASKILRKNIKYADVNENANLKSANRKQRSYLKLISKSNEQQMKNNYEKAVTYLAKANGKKEKEELYKNTAKKYSDLSKTLNNRLSDISSNKIKAGEDYVVNTYLDTNIPLDALGFLNVGSNSILEFK